MTDKHLAHHIQQAVEIGQLTGVCIGMQMLLDEDQDDRTDEYLQRLYDNCMVALEAAVGQPGEDLSLRIQRQMAQVKKEMRDETD